MPDVALALHEALAPVLAGPHGEICVALSGGLDSTVLAHALARSGVGPCRALHVNHQLQPAADDWARHCERLCARLAIPLAVLTVSVERGSSGPEAAARRARYDAFAATLRANDVLLTAHHQDDQVETVLLHLLRGSGITGLGGIPRAGRVGQALLLRPFLDLPRATLLAYARREELDWIDDPSNADRQLDRNFIRHEVVPLLGSRWPGLRTTIGRSARLAGEAADLLEALAADDARGVQRRGRLRVSALASLGETRARLLVRRLCWRELGSAPPAAMLREGLAQLMAAPPDRAPLLAWPGGEIRRYRGALHLLKPQADDLPSGPLELAAQPGAALSLGAGLGRLRLARTRVGGISRAKLVSPLTVRFRTGGERLRPAGQRHHRELKKLLQEHGVVPWMRERIPLLYCGGELAAVAHWWIADGFAARGGEPALAVRWEQRPILQ